MKHHSSQDKSYKALTASTSLELWRDNDDQPQAEVRIMPPTLGVAYKSAVSESKLENTTVVSPPQSLPQKQEGMILQPDGIPEEPNLTIVRLFTARRLRDSTRLGSW